MKDTEQKKKQNDNKIWEIFQISFKCVNLVALLQEIFIFKWIKNIIPSICLNCLFFFEKENQSLLYLNNQKYGLIFVCYDYSQQAKYIKARFGSLWK